MATSLYNLASVLHDKRDYEGAEPLYRNALAMDRRLLGEHPSTAISMSSLARLLCDRGDDESARQLFEEAFEMFSKSVGADHWRLAGSRADYGTCLIQQERYGSAEELLLAAHPVLSASLGPEHDRTRKAVTHLVELYEAWGKPEEAAEYRALLPKDDQPQQ